MAMPSALEISRRAALKPAAEIGIPPWLIEPYGEHGGRKVVGVAERTCGDREEREDRLVRHTGEGSPH